MYFPSFYDPRISSQIICAPTEEIIVQFLRLSVSRNLSGTSVQIAVNFGGQRVLGPRKRFEYGDKLNLGLLQIDNYYFQF